MEMEACEDAVFLYSYGQMMNELEDLWKKNPERVRMELLGWSGKGRSILEVILGRKDADRHILVQAGMHGREYMNTALMVRMMKQYLEQTRNDWKIKDGPQAAGLEAVCIHVMPMVNPDGVMLSRFSAPLWKANAKGVDINRNFDAGWETYQGAKKPGAEGFKGAYPSSEPETAAVLKAAGKYKLDACISYHSSGNVVYWDYGSQGALYEAEKRLAEAVRKSTGYPLKSARESKAAPAGCSDYFVQRLGIPAVTIETGKGKCPLKACEFEEIYRRNRNLLLEIRDFGSIMKKTCGKEDRLWSASMN